ncbi:coiled-coil domain-containing protein 42 homolog [Nematostella vectensis]|uniref:coiled-coil domain-containing protein 42 homolog n=1 Tax=Nematostella vectensis TaxID=45351 RepID=UPI0020773AA3|nr:coiled-coil domain-containing protein 42 homolog [Nematostella vectensis]
MAESDKYKLELEEQKKNVFVTQLREEDDEDVETRKYQVVNETSGKLLETGLKTFQSTLLLKKQLEVEKVQEDLEIKRQQFAERMAACKRKEEELKKKQLQIRDRVGKFEKFIKENEAKRRRAVQKYQTELKLKDQKSKEEEILAAELQQLKARKHSLEAKIAKYSVYEKYLLKVLDFLPEDYLEASDSMLMGIMMRFRTLSATNHTLMQMLSDKADGVEQSQQKLLDMNNNHTQHLVLINSELAHLQQILEETSQKNAELDQLLINNKTTVRHQSEILGRIQLAINNISERCQRRVLVPVETLDYDTKLHLIQDHISEYNDICRLAKPSEGGPLSTNGPVSSASILKKDARTVKTQESALKSGGARGRHPHQELRFAADVK